MHFMDTHVTIWPWATWRCQRSSHYLLQMHMECIQVLISFIYSHIWSLTWMIQWSYWLLHAKPSYWSQPVIHAVYFLLYEPSNNNIWRSSNWSRISLCNRHTCMEYNSHNVHESTEVTVACSSLDLAVAFYICVNYPMNCNNIRTGCTGYPNSSTGYPNSNQVAIFINSCLNSVAHVS